MTLSEKLLSSIYITRTNIEHYEDNQFDVLSFNNTAHVLFQKMNSSSLQITVTDKIYKNIWNCQVFTTLPVSDLQWVRNHNIRQAVQSSNTDLQLLLSLLPSFIALSTLSSCFWWFWLWKPHCPLATNEYNSVQWSAPVISELNQFNKRAWFYFWLK